MSRDAYKQTAPRLCDFCGREVAECERTRSVSTATLLACLEATARRADALQARIDAALAECAAGWDGPCQLVRRALAGPKEP